MNLEVLRDDLGAEVRRVIEIMIERESLPPQVAIACASAGLRRLADSYRVDYGAAEQLGAAHYREEQRRT